MYLSVSLTLNCPIYSYHNFTITTTIIAKSHSHKSHQSLLSRRETTSNFSFQHPSDQKFHIQGNVGPRKIQKTVSRSGKKNHRQVCLRAKLKILHPRINFEAPCMFPLLRCTVSRRHVSIPSVCVQMSTKSFRLLENIVSSSQDLSRECACTPNPMFPPTRSRFRQLYAVPDIRHASPAKDIHRAFSKSCCNRHGGSFW